MGLAWVLRAGIVLQAHAGTNRPAIRPESRRKPREGPERGFREVQAPGGVRRYEIIEVRYE